MAKIFSRPGPYDVLVEQAELVAHLNLKAFRSEYPANAKRWAAGGTQGQPSSPAEILQAHLYPAARPLAAGPPTAERTE